MFKKICSFLSGLLLIILVALAALLLVPRLFGYQNMAVLTGSMEPKYPVGSLIYVKEVDPVTLKIGDVITYRLDSDTVVTHRIVEIDSEKKEVITKGDANNVNDSKPISYSNIMGKASWCIPYLGYISIYIKTPVGIMIGCGIAAIIILLTFLPEILSKDEENEN